MGVKMTLAEKWDDRWFRRLDPMEKLAFLYLCDRCDCAGFLEMDIEKFAFDTRIVEEDWEKMLVLEGSSKGLEGSSKGLEGSSKGLNSFNLLEKVTIHGRWIWIKNHIRHQKNLPLSAKNTMHKGIVKRLTDHIDIPGVGDFLGRNVENIDNFVSLKHRPYPDPTQTLARVTGKGTGRGRGRGKGGDCKEGEEDLPDGTGSDNEAFQKIAGHPNMSGLTYEQYLAALKDYDITQKDVDRNIGWLMKEAVLFGSADMPGKWLARRFSEMESAKNGKNKKAGGPAVKEKKDLMEPIMGGGEKKAGRAKSERGAE